MADFNYKGFSYELIIRNWKKGKEKYEAIRWKIGYRNFWERIKYDDYLKAKSSKIK